MYHVTLKQVRWGVFGSLQTILASGVTLSLFAASAVISTSAAAPSLSVLALAAVTVPEGGGYRTQVIRQSTIAWYYFTPCPQLVSPKPCARQERKKQINVENIP